MPKNNLLFSKQWRTLDRKQVLQRLVRLEWQQAFEMMVSVGTVRRKVVCYSYCTMLWERLTQRMLVLVTRWQVTLPITEWDEFPDAQCTKHSPDHLIHWLKRVLQKGEISSILQANNITDKLTKKEDKIMTTAATTTTSAATATKEEAKPRKTHKEQLNYIFTLTGVAPSLRLPCRKAIYCLVDKQIYKKNEDQWEKDNDRNNNSIDGNNSKATTETKQQCQMFQSNEF